MNLNYSSWIFVLFFITQLTVKIYNDKLKTLFNLSMKTQISSLIIVLAIT